MSKLLIIDDNATFYRGLEAVISLKASNFEIVKYIQDPAEPNKVNEGELANYLNKNFSCSENSGLIILLDMHFGNKKGYSYLGVEIAKYLHTESPVRNCATVIAMTNYEDQILCDNLYTIGIRNFLFKSEIEHQIVASLAAAKRGNSFLTGFIPSPKAEEEATKIADQVSKMIAKGYSVKSIENNGYSSAGAQKSNSKSTIISAFANKTFDGHKMPNKREDWNDALFLFYYLSKGDKEIIDYVQKMCDIKIQVNIPKT